MSAASVRPEERQLNLVLALVATPNGLSKEQILRSVQGYAERAGGDRRALEKMFERDKQDLREAGIPILTLGAFDDPDNNQDSRYTIPKTEYELPDDIAFTPAEIALLNLAAAVWSQGSLSGAAQSALMKIRSLGIDVDEPILGFAPRISLREPAFGALRTANEKALVVRFAYLRPGDAAATARTVEPHALLEYEGRWHLFGLDHDRGTERTFLLSRISGPVTITDEPFAPERRDGAATRARHALDALAASQHAVLEVAPDTEAALRLGRRGRTVDGALHLPFVDAHVLADELASFGPEVLVREPARLRELVIAQLTRVRDAHDGPAPAGSDADAGTRAPGTRRGPGRRTGRGAVA